MKNKSIVLVSSLFFAVVSFFSCAKPRVYMEPNSPRYHSNKVMNNDDFTDNDVIYAMSYNIEHSLNIDQAIDVIRADSNLSRSSIIFLQEMDNHGVEVIANTLGYNYVYYPISNGPEVDKDFGNAILSKGKIYDDSKVIVPYGDSYNCRKRAVTHCKTLLGDKEISLYSAHLSTLVIPTDERKKQVDSLIDHIEINVPNNHYCITGGDFNTVTSDYRNSVINKFAAIDYTHASVDIGETYNSNIAILEPQLDLIFTNQFTVLDQGKVVNSEASDHYPIWVKLGLY